MSEPGSLLRSLAGRTTARNFHSYVINEIGAGVINGRFPVGSTLPNDAALMAEFDVSRTVLREALKTLEAKGLLEARPKVGTKVAKRTRWNLYDPQVLAWHFGQPLEREFLAGLREMRRVVEPAAAARAAQRRTADHLRLMQYWVRQMETSASEIQNFALADFELHRIIADASQNPFMRSFIGVIELSHAFAYRPLVEDAGPHDLEEIIAAHRTLVSAVERGEPEAAHSAMLATIAIDEEKAGV
ncbi:FadR/GntR family transcriptional regulator [Gellertiella hungarica]|uniref:DNA-binding FadR family transcriptional regulator n=1 Tax=Gellertiella hungarica TaxID=1572859 RepID=A0A7W6NM47_9HYPH|nr:FadR/GntR family transcriptional regulator [Gellertiella hungarica]MBB4066578.1 DNA-binding FadR family transcriptional regulator [Gellertiella hungarica]